MADDTGRELIHIKEVPGQITATSLELPPGIPVERWVEIGSVLRVMERTVQWWIGDWLNYGINAYGEKYVRALKATDYKKHTLENTAYVCSKIPTSRRREVCSFAHHAEVAALEPEEQDTWLDQAEQKRWNRATLRQAIKESKPSEYPSWLKYNDVWSIPSCDGRFGTDYPGRTPGQAIQNLLYYYTEEGDLVIDPMAGGGTVLDVCGNENRRCMAFDIKPSREDIGRLDATKPWPIKESADLVFLDPPYWSQREGEYGGMAGLSYRDYLAEVRAIVVQAHANLKADGKLAILIAPMAVKTEYIDIPFDLVGICAGEGFRLIRRISVPVGGQQVGPGVVGACKKGKQMIALLRDLLIFRKGRSN